MNPFTPHLLALIAVGGATGSVLRYATGVWCIRWFGVTLPWGTLAVNVIGSAVIGLLGGLIAAEFPISAEARALLITGVLGGFTTFSSFSLEVGTLFLRSPTLSIAYLGLSLVGGLGAFALTFALSRAIAH